MIGLSNPKIYLDGKEIGESKEVKVETEIFTDTNYDIPIYREASLTGTLKRTKGLRKLIKSFKKMDNQTKATVKVVNKFLKKITNTEGKEKYLKRMRNRIKKEKEGR